MTGPRRVALFVAYPHVYGGTERQVELLASGLQQRGWTVEILLPATGVAADRFRAAGLHVDVVEAPPSLLVYGRNTRRGRAVRATVALPAYWTRLRRRVAGAGLVHTFTQRGFLLAGPAARLARLPLVWHVGGRDPGRLLNQAAARTASAVIAVSRAAAEGLPTAREVEIVPNAVDPAAFAAPAPAPASAEGFHLACAARLTPEKGIDVLVRATALLRQDFPDLQVLVLGGTQAGHEAYGEELVRLAGDLGVDSAVCLKGFVDQPFRSWAGSRVYVQPSRREGFGLAVAEAMASGLPVVATAVGGLTDVLDGGRAGVLVAPDDPRALADGIKALLDDPARAERLAAAGRARAATEYTVDAMVDRVEAVYDRLLA
ncbi:MAG TPA: glycosyltransferase family 4 protein [Acidimicrobiales bacterium]|nr:glycosyltransferase family 4 protein [Acidimicrobiales bacterium]